MKHSEDSLYIFCYDFPADKYGNKRRAKAVKILKGHGIRVQYSVFEARFKSPEELRKIIGKLERIMDTKLDSLRVYPMDGVTEKKIQILGQGEVLVREDVYVF